MSKTSDWAIRVLNEEPPLNKYERVVRYDASMLRMQRIWAYLLKRKMRLYR